VGLPDVSAPSTDTLGDRCQYVASLPPNGGHQSVVAAISAGTIVTPGGAPSTGPPDDGEHVGIELGEIRFEELWKRRPAHFGVTAVSADCRRAGDLGPNVAAIPTSTDHRAPVGAVPWTCGIGRRPIPAAVSLDDVSAATATQGQCDGYRGTKYISAIAAIGVG
jgi:hypothetical protein